jgi:O-antigen ligase
MILRDSLIKLQRWWLLALLFLIPLSLKYIVKEPYAISWLNLLSVGFIGIGVLNALLGSLPLRPIKHRPFVVLLYVFLAVMAFALFFTHPFRNGIGLWTSRLVQPLLVGFFAYQLFVCEKVKVDDCVQALFWSLVPLLIVGTMQAFGIIEYRDPGRITATYFYPNTFARYVEILLLITLPWILFSRQRGKRLHLGIWLLGIVLLLTSQSYNGVVSFGAGLVTILLLLPRPLSQLKRTVLIGLALITLVVALQAPKLPKWQTSITDSRLTRLEFWHVALGVIQDNFWTGIGIKTWEATYPKLVEKYGPFPPLNWGSVQPHNVFLDSFIKAGLPGFFAITTLLLWPIFEGIAFTRSYAQRNPNWWYGLSMAGYGVAMLVFGLIDDPIWSDDTMPLLFILFFILAYLVQNKKVTALL